MKSRSRCLWNAALAAALLCAAAGVPAQTIYKQVDDEGRTTFSDRQPAPRAIVPRRGSRVDEMEADRRLKQAQLERKRGVEPRVGEFTPGAASRTLNYRYWRRQENLRLLVEQAQRRSSETQRLQVAAR